MDPEPSFKKVLKFQLIIIIIQIVLFIAVLGISKRVNSDLQECYQLLEERNHDKTINKSKR